jgi:hypothetical protein
MTDKADRAIAPTVALARRASLNEPRGDPLRYARCPE